MIPLGDLAAQFALGSELLMSVVAPRMNKTIHGRLEGGLLYTSAYIARIKAQVWIMHATQRLAAMAWPFCLCLSSALPTMLCCCNFSLPQHNFRKTVNKVAVTAHFVVDSKLLVGT